MKISHERWARRFTIREHSGMVVGLFAAAVFVTGAAAISGWFTDSAPTSLLDLSTIQLPVVAGADEAMMPVAVNATSAIEASAVPATEGVAAADATVTTTDVAAATAFESEICYFDGRPVRPVKTIQMLVTAYSPDARSCPGTDDGITASGYSVWTNGGKMIAADRMFKFGTLMSVPGYNDDKPTPVFDRGGKIKGHHLDVLYPTHEEALVWGKQRVLVTIWEYADQPAAYPPSN